MSFKQSLLSQTPSSITPSQSLADLISQHSNELTNVLALLFSEILVPGSQCISSSTSTKTTALTPSTLPEATARGSQFRSLLKGFNIEHSTWDRIIELIFETDDYFSDAKSISQVTVASVSQFLASLESENIDKFLKYVAHHKIKDHPFLFQKNILVSLYSLSPQQGAIDLLSCPLQPVLANEPNSRRTIIWFKYIAELEVTLLVELKSRPATAEENQINEIIEDSYKTAPEYLGLAALHLWEENKGNSADPGPGLAYLNLSHHFIVQLLDINSPYLIILLSEFKEISEEELSLLLANYVPLRPNGAATVATYALRNGVLISVLNKLSKFTDCLNVAIEATNLGWNGLEKFIQNLLINNPKQVQSQLVDFLEEQSSFEYQSSNNENNAQIKPHRSLSIPVVYTLLKAIEGQKLAGDLVDKFKNVQVSVIQAYPRLINFGRGHDEAILANGNSHSFPPSVEQEMKSYYQKMYLKQLEIKSVINSLKAFKESDNPHEQDIFACMIHSLLDEYRFFPEYPIDALATTSVLFGSTIYFQLIEGTTLTIALRYILESCRQPPEDNMFKFAVQALYTFREKLGDYKSYCALLLEVPSLKHQPQIYEILQQVMNGTYRSPQSVSSQGNGSGDRQLLQGKQPPKDSLLVSKFKSLNLSIELQRRDQETPDENVSDHVLFIVNNMTEENLTAKVEEMNKVLQPQYFEWFSTYLVTQRVKTEPNYHSLYCSLTSQLDNLLLDAYILNLTFKEIILILNKCYDVNDEISATERTHLKNLGSWLGLITLTRNRPLKHRNLALKMLVLEAYDKNKLEVVLPLVCKILDQAKNSKVFLPPNPWTMGNLSLLKELYEIGNLPLKLKFEIEVLYNSLKIKLGDIEAANIIKTHQPTDIDQFAVATNMMKELTLSNVNQLKHQQQQQQQQQQHQQQQQQQLFLQQQAALQAQQVQQPQMPFDPQSNPGVSSALPVDESSQLKVFSNLLGTTSFVTIPTLKYLFQAALARAVKEILPLVVDRTNLIALVTTKALVSKDFALEPDEAKFRTAYINQVSYLTESLSLASCRDPLRESIQMNALQIANTMPNIDSTLFEELPQAITDNIDLASTIIQKAAVERAIQDIDELMAPQLAIRRQHREIKPNQQFIDPTMRSRYPMLLPVPLGLKSDGVIPKQFMIYENFGKNRIVSPMQQPEHLQNLNSQLNPSLRQGTQQPLVPPGVAEQMKQQLPPALQGQGGAVSLEQTFMFLQQLVDSVINLTRDAPEKIISEVNTDSVVVTVLGEILQTCVGATVTDALILKISQYVMNMLFVRTNSSLTQNTLVFLLDKLSELSPFTAKDISWWLVNAEDERKYNKNVMRDLILLGLVPLAELDRSLALQIEKKNVKAVLFTIYLIHDSILSEEPIALRADLINSIEALQELAHESSEIGRKAYMSISRLKAVVKSNAVQIFKMFGSSNMTKKQYMSYVFAEWVKLVQYSRVDRVLEDFIWQLVDDGIVNNSENLSLLITTATEMSVAAFSKEADPSKKLHIETYAPADALALLLVKLLLMQEDSTGTERKSFFNSMLAVIILAFTIDHNSNSTSFNERPYFRIFSSLFSYWLSARHEFEDGNDESLKRFNSELYLILAQNLMVMQPSLFPGFTFAWISLISHRMFMPMILEVPENEGWGKFVNLLQCLLSFQLHYVDSEKISDVVNVVYKGTLRIIALLSHDFPDLLVQHHYQLISSTPESYVQLKNLISSALPKGVTVPNPFQQGLKVDRLEEIMQEPPIGYHPELDLAAKGLKKPVESYLRIPSQALLKTISTTLNTSEPKTGKSKYDVGLVNALVFFVGIAAAEEQRSFRDSSSFDSTSNHVMLLSHLIKEGDVELQNLILTAIANHLRYPNAHTHWFSCILLHFVGSATLWGDQRQAIQFNISCVLTKRAMSYNPIPWGIMVTFLELVSNSEYEIFSSPFIKGDATLERLFGTLQHHIRNQRPLGEQPEPLKL